MAGAPTALTVEIAARAVADAAYPSGFVPNVVLPSGLPGHRPAAEFFRAQGRAQGRAHGRAQGQRLAERAALAARDARRQPKDVAPGAPIDVGACTGVAGQRVRLRALDRHASAADGLL